MFNIIARKTLLWYAKEYLEAANSLFGWYHEMVNANIKDFQELKRQFGNASILGDDRVVFNIGGNKYRLVVRIVFDYKVVQIKWFGTHAQYDKVNVKIVAYKNKNNGTPNY
jgi:mRNA interferase HigB